MADPVTELRNEVYATMAAYTALTDLARVYDEAPQDNPTVRLPYVTLGPANYDIELVDCIEGGEIMLQVDVWSDQPGQAQVTALAGLVRKSLRGFAPELTDNALVEFSHWRTDYLIDGSIKHAAMRFTAFVEESAS